MEDMESPKGEAPGEPDEEERILNDIPLPPPTFDFLILSLHSQAEMQLGMLHFGEEKDRPKPNLRLARHTIDLMAMLLDKTKGNLSMEEQRHIENALTELRFRYVQVAESSASQ
jgi:hypothetical protein